MIDVLIPVYNAENTVHAAVTSIFKQTIRDIRVIVVDDGSTDRTGEVLDQLAEIDARLLVKRTENAGIVAALNTALSLATADIIARHDADDLAYPNRFAVQLAYLDRHPDCIAVSANARHVDVEGKPIGVTRFGGDATGNFETIPGHSPYLMHPFLMARHSALRTVGGYRYVLHAEDSDLYWRLAEIGRLHNLTDVLGDYRIHDQSITSKSIRNVRAAAVSSQLSAVSAARRARSQSDLEFSAAKAKQLNDAESLVAMVRYASEQLSRAEKNYLTASVAAKMMELRIYRPFRFTLSDIRFIFIALVKNIRLLNIGDVGYLAMNPVHYMRPRVRLRNTLNFVGARSLAARL